MLRLLTFALLTSLVVSSAFAADPPGLTRREWKVGADTREALIYAPATAKEKDYFGFGFPVAGKTTVRLKFRVRVTSCVEVGRRGGYWYTGKSWGRPGSTPGS